jgi:hypothetical protein
MMWDRTGYALYSKQLEKGTFELPGSGKMGGLELPNYSLPHVNTVRVNLTISYQIHFNITEAGTLSAPIDMYLLQAGGTYFNFIYQSVFAFFLFCPSKLVSLYRNQTKNLIALLLGKFLNSSIIHSLSNIFVMYFLPSAAVG